MIIAILISHWEAHTCVRGGPLVTAEHLLACLLACLLAGTAADSELHPDFRKRLPGGTTLHRDAGGEVCRQTAEHAGSRGATSPAILFAKKRLDVPCESMIAG